MKIVMGIVLATAAIALAPSAAADTTFYPSGLKGDGSFVNYWHDLVTHGINSDLPTASALGSTICTKMRDGASEATMVELGGKAQGVTHSQAQIAVFGAEFHFCPEYY
jgi:hypothetical protein